MHLQIIISRLSNFLFYVQKTDEHNLVKFDLQKYLSDEDINLSFYRKSEDRIWKQIKESVGEEGREQIKKQTLCITY